VNRMSLSKACAICVDHVDIRVSQIDSFNP
jgi:hypothetical protein